MLILTALCATREVRGVVRAAWGWSLHRKNGKELWYLHSDYKLWFDADQGDAETLGTVLAIGQALAWIKEARKRPKSEYLDEPIQINVFNGDLREHLGLAERWRKTRVLELAEEEDTYKKARWLWALDDRLADRQWAVGKWDSKNQARWQRLYDHTRELLGKMVPA